MNDPRKDYYDNSSFEEAKTHAAFAFSDLAFLRIPIIITIFVILISMGTRINRPIHYTTLDDAMKDALKNPQKITFVTERNSDNFVNCNSTDGVSYWQMLSPDEQAEVMNRVTATDECAWDILNTSSSIYEKYEKYIKKPERIVRKRKEIKKTIAGDLAVMDGIMEDMLRQSEFADFSSGAKLNSDGTCGGGYFGEYKSIVQIPGTDPVQEEERAYRIYTYEYLDKAYEYAGGVYDILQALDDNSRGWYKKSRVATNFRMSHQDVVDALNDACEARVAVYNQLGLTPPTL